MAAGHSALTVTPVGAHSRAAVLVSARSASLAALYSSDPMWALTPLRLPDAAAPCVVDENVQHAVFGNRCGTGVLDLVSIGHVGADEQAADVIRDGLARGFVELCDDDSGAFVGEPPCDAFADSRACTGDQRNLARQCSAH